MLIREEGPLVFSGRWNERPCALHQGGDKYLELYPLFEDALARIDGKRAREVTRAGEYLLTIDVSSRLVLDYAPGVLACLKDVQKAESRTLALPIMLLVSIGQCINVEIGEGYIQLRRD